MLEGLQPQIGEPVAHKLFHPIVRRRVLAPGPLSVSLGQQINVQLRPLLAQPPNLVLPERKVECEPGHRYTDGCGEDGGRQGDGGV